MTGCYKNYLKLTISIIAISAIAVPPVTAQEDEIIVTARKKEETLLDAPLAISAFGEIELEQAGFENILDVAKATPGLFIENFNSGVNNNARVDTTPRFRGVFIRSGSRLQQTASVFLDGVAISGGIQNIGVNELQRVEITKGPQSALYGRNTFSGAINYVTKDPSDQFEAELDATVATRDEYRVAAGVSGPIAEGIGFRVAGSYSDVAGHYDNFAAPGEKLGDQSQWNVNGTLMFEPSSNFRVKVRGSYREIDDGAAAITGGAFGPATHNFGGFVLDTNCNAVPGAQVSIPNSNTPCTVGVGSRTNSIFRGTIRGSQIPASEIGINTSSDVIETFRNSIQNNPNFDPATNVLVNDFKYSPFEKDDFGLDLDEIRFSANAEFDISEDISLTLLGGFSEENFGLFAELDQTPDNSFTSFVARGIEDFSVEGRLSGALLEDDLDWTIGASFTDIEVQELASTANVIGNAFAFGDGFRSDPFTSGAETIGLFASLDYNISEDFTVILEGRYQEDTIINETVNESVPGLSPATLTNFLPRATLRYEPSTNTTFYATYGEGNLPGGFNAEFASLSDNARNDVLSRSPTASITFDEETLTNYELGWKQTTTDGRAAFNLAAFYMERSDEIFVALETAPDDRPNAVNERRTVTFTSNGATTDIYGFELDGAVNPTENLSLNASLAYIDASIASFPDNGGTDRFGLVFGPNENPTGQQAPKFPPWSGSFSATYERPIELFGDIDTWFLRGDTYYTGTYYTSNANLTSVDDAVDVNLRTGFRGEDMSLEFFVTNLFQEQTPTSAQTFADTSFDVRFAPGGFFNFNAIGNRLGLRDRRQFGVRAKYTFD